jgi:hypothetical protein
MKYLLSVSFSILLTWAPQSAVAIELPDLPLEINGEISPYYYLNLTEEQREVKDYRITGTERKYRNYFAVGAAYLGFNLDITDGIYADLLLSKTGSNYIDYAYAGFKNVIPRHEIHVGLVKTPWVHYEDELWGWRFVRNVGVKKHYLLGEEDWGVGIEGDVLKPYIGHHFSFTNGDLYGRGKAVEYRLSVFPLAGVKSLEGFSINGLLHYGNLFGDDYTYYFHHTDEDLTYGPFKANAYGVLVGFDHRFITLGAGYFERAEGDTFEEYPKPYYSRDVITYLITGYATAHILPWLDALGRFDFVEPDTSSRNDPRTEYYNESYDKYLDGVVGAGFTFGDGHFKIVPNYQTRIPEQEVNVGEDPDHEYHAVFITTEHYFYVHMQASF